MNGIDRHYLRNAAWKQPALHAATAVVETLQSFDTGVTEHMFLKTLIVSVRKAWLYLVWSEVSLSMIVAFPNNREAHA